MVKVWLILDQPLGDDDDHGDGDDADGNDDLNYEDDEESEWTSSDLGRHIEFASECFSLF